MLRAADIRVVLGGATVLEGASLSVAPGDFVAVLGPNGAGKSTLLFALSGAVTPDQGWISLDDRPLADWRPQALARRRALLPQHSELTFPFRVLEVVLLGRSPYAGLSCRQEDLSTARAALAETGTGHLTERVYTTLSGGERQRVQTARVLAQIDCGRPDREAAGRYLLLDEPTSSLDPAHQHATLETARRAAGNGVGVVAILHDLNLAAMYADRILMLHEGHIVAEGRPLQVLTESTIGHVFDLPVRVERHPTRACPHVIAV